MEDLTMPREPSAAQALYGHLKSGAREPVERRQGGSIADAMYPSLVPKPKAAPNSPREPEVSLAQRCDEDPWFEWRLAMGGLRRVRR
jgi:hypothetical protein